MLFFGDTLWATTLHEKRSRMTWTYDYCTGNARAESLFYEKETRLAWKAIMTKELESVIY